MRRKEDDRMGCNTGILIFIFNRPDFTARLYKQLELTRPGKLYVASDGARNEKEKAFVEESRAIFKSVSWECEIKYNFSETNLGLRKRIVTGIDWAFTDEDQLIILEDDCIPHPDFFPFCEAMLAKYKDNDRVMTINGCNLNPSLTADNQETYIFSRYANSWGWATWRRAWQNYDSELTGLYHPEINKILKSHLTSPARATLYWRYKLNEVKATRINSWAYRWIFSLFINRGLAIVPKTNLIRNIGSDERSTNTRGRFHFINIPTTGLDTSNYIAPKDIIANDVFDRWVENSVYSKSFKFRLKWIMKKILFQI